MSHPFLTKKTLALYSIAWIIPFLLQIWVVSKYESRPLGIACVGSLVSNGIFYLLGLSLWFFVRYTLTNSAPWYKNITAMFTSCTIIIVIWLTLSHGLLQLLFPEQKAYFEYTDERLPGRIIYGFFIFVLIILSYYLHISYENIREKISNEARLREMLKDSELDMLKSQINPHFLFNSLNSVNWLTQIEPEKASEMIVSLSEYLRYSIAGGHRSLSSLEVEMENITRYINIEKIRFGEKLRAEYKIEEDCRYVRIPSMILQPLYENAIKHGVYESTDPVWIETDISGNEDYVRIVIQNSYEPNTPYQKGNGLGLNNVRQRLRLIYGDTASLETQKQETLFTAILLIPRLCPSEL